MLMYTKMLKLWHQILSSSVGKAVDCISSDPKMRFRMDVQAQKGPLFFDIRKRKKTWRVLTCRVRVELGLVLDRDSNRNIFFYILI